MDAAGAAEARERITKWIEETRQLFALLPALLDTQVNERASAAEKEVERLRKEIEDLKKEALALRGERDEIGHAVSLVIQKFGLAPRKSPFERTPGGDHPKTPEPPKAVEPPKVTEPAKAADRPKV
jgi:plasmid stabilization system protein ParE